MDRRSKLERIIAYYAIPSYRRTLGHIVARRPLDWFTDEQLEDVAREMVGDDRRTQQIRRRNLALAKQRKAVA